jgi:hypothetical protein
MERLGYSFLATKKKKKKKEKFLAGLGVRPECIENSRDIVWRENSMKSTLTKWVSSSVDRPPEPSQCFDMASLWVSFEGIPLEASVSFSV